MPVNVPPFGELPVPVIGDALAAARLWSVSQAPYLATALFAMSPTITEGLGTMATDRRWHLYLDPKVLDVWTTEQIGSVLIHEAHHLLRGHGDRAIALGVTELTHRRFNVAADFEINDDLRDLPLPSGGLDPKDYGYASGELAETYYSLLESAGPLPGALCGSGSHGVTEGWEIADNDGPSVDDIEADLIRRQVAVDVRVAAQRAGSVPAGLERWARALLQPKVDWRRELAAHVRSGVDSVSGAVDYSYRRPSRRLGSPLGRAVVFPALIQPVPRVAVVVDTSGSMSERALSQALAEISGIMRSSGIGRTRLTVIACDHAVQSTQHVFAASQVRLTGGGGTNMGAGIAQAATIRPRHEVVVVVTDGLTPWPQGAPGLRVVVALLGDGPAPPPWAYVVRIPMGDD